MLKSVFSKSRNGFYIDCDEIGIVYDYNISIYLDIEFNNYINILKNNNAHESKRFEVIDYIHNTSAEPITYDLFNGKPAIKNYHFKRKKDCENAIKELEPYYLMKKIKGE